MLMSLNAEVSIINVIRDDIIRHLLKYVDQRFRIDEDIVAITEPFVSLTFETDIQKVHEEWASDLDLASLNMQFTELADNEDLQVLELPQLMSHLAKHDAAVWYGDILTALSRILAATPHSADVERMISANNLLKTSLRSSLSVETKNRYLLVHFNMPNKKCFQILFG